MDDPASEQRCTNQAYSCHVHVPWNVSAVVIGYKNKLSECWMVTHRITLSGNEFSKYSKSYPVPIFAISKANLEKFLTAIVWRTYCPVFAVLLAPKFRCPIGKKWPCTLKCFYIPSAICNCPFLWVHVCMQNPLEHTQAKWQLRFEGNHESEKLYNQQQKKAKVDVAFNLLLFLLNQLIIHVYIYMPAPLPWPHGPEEFNVFER